MAVGHLPASLFSRADVGITLPARPLDLVFGWILPIALVCWAVRYTARARRGPDDTARADTGHRPSGRPDGPRDLHGPGGSNVTAPTPITRG
jgi:hypothetical protein